MTKTSLALALLVLVAVPAFAQTNEVGISLGGVNRRLLALDKRSDVTTSWSFGSSVKEIYYSITIEPDVHFKIKAGEMDSSVTFVTTVPAIPATDTTAAVPAVSTRHNATGQIEHIEGVADYRFAEPFGSTGLFAGVGLYRQKGGGMSETNYGFSAGVNGDFPINKRSGVIVEGTYHWTNFDAGSRYITATAGLRYRF
jgi:hypothetical protein